MTSPAQTSPHSAAKTSSRGARGLGQQVVPEARAAGQRGPQGLGHRPLGRRVGGRRPEQGRVLAEVDRHPAAADAAGARARPRRSRPAPPARPARRPVIGQAARQHLRLPLGRRQRQPLERRERVAQRVGPAGRAGPVDALPIGQEAPERARVGRLDLAPQRGEARAAQPPHHLGVAPLAPRPARAQLAAHQRPVGLEGRQRRLDGPRLERVAARELGRMEGPVTAGVAGHERPQRLGHRLQERLGHAARRHRAEPVAVAAGVLGRDQAPLAGQVDPDRAPVGDQRLGDLLGPPRLGHARRDLVRAQVADAAQQVVQAVGPAGPGPLGEALQVGLDGGQRPGVDEVAQLLLAQQLAQQVAVERQRLGAALGRRRVVLVHVRGDVLEQQRPGERRGGRRLDLHHGDLARARSAPSSPRSAGRSNQSSRHSR